jgi:hypothetical protein
MAEFSGAQLVIETSVSLGLGLPSYSRQEPFVGRLQLFDILMLARRLQHFDDCDRLAQCGCTSFCLFGQAFHDRH